MSPRITVNNKFSAESADKSYNNIQCSLLVIGVVMFQIMYKTGMTPLLSAGGRLSSALLNVKLERECLRTDAARS